MKSLNSFSVLIIFFLSACSQPKDPLEIKIDETIDIAKNQYKHMMSRLPNGKYPKTYYAEKDEFETTESWWWCSGFYPGSLIYLDELSEEPIFKNEINRVLDDLKKEQYNTTTHDLGFMMYCSYGNTNRLNPSDEYKSILMNSAKSLASRFNDTIGCIKSWDSTKDDYLVIIDNMMNLELLFWATEHSKDSTYYDIAIKHANTTIKNHFREDYSSYHVLNYMANGDVKRKRTEQGFSDSSAWARGQAWGLYGYTVTYRKTKDPKYLEQATKIANFILNHPNLPEDKVPYWDFNAPDIPDALRDSSAAAIIASALLELKDLVTDEALSKQYFNDSTIILNTLLTDEYIAKNNTNGGFLLKHGVGHLPQNSEVDVPLTYADYYLIEAMLRYKNLK
ncbi:glycoside hydrolase family 88 protein [Flaviramulus sp. BrNp1-15]|nr:glycoside hydrolase family 88 protein [Flaviramulus sp. BrNp1-15]ULC58728.1 glycoside hydrolase family 88 protein [Flaviramulus sp. BrNp1-15]